ncbi:hypothetical protein EVAR_84348_1 [Eumeta japonica]|uniref:Uncharacterized protein n=1 Tax=Eumeta variegata TaxID=151549 RepID=A0A4C1U4A9_EUMVA|nr:hypothetical protein EVAR_84348_1 [Eumeta japonica]
MTFSLEGGESDRLPSYGRQHRQYFNAQAYRQRNTRTEVRRNEIFGTKSSAWWGPLTAAVDKATPTSGTYSLRRICDEKRECPRSHHRSRPPDRRVDEQGYYYQRIRKMK